MRLRGFSPRGDKIDQRALVNEFSARFGPILNILPEATRGSWLKAITHLHKRAFAPLHHILIRLLIESIPLVEASNPFGLAPWPCRNPLAEHYGQSVITNCKLHKQHGKSIGCFPLLLWLCLQHGIGTGSRARILDLGRMFKTRLRELVTAGSGLWSTANVLHVTPNTGVLRYAALLGLETPWKAR